jgi:hypothetical protein
MRWRVFLGVLVAALPVFGQQAITPAGTSAKNAQPVQGVTGGVPLHTVCDSGCGGAATFSDNSAFTAGTTSVNISGGVFNDSLTALSSGQAAAPRMTSKRALHFNLRDASGVEIPFPAALDADLGFKVHIQNTVAVTGTFFQTTQPVSGTFFQTTQPVSIASMPSTPVTGTFWQATQPVSGTFFQVTQPVSLASLPALVSGSALVGKVGIDQTTPGTTDHVSAILLAGSAVVGHVIADSGSTTAVTGNVTVQQATGTNLHAVLDTTSTTAVTQTTGSNLHAQLDSGSTTAVTQATAANLNATVVQGGTWTVQPGNTANTTAWKVDGSAVTQPVSGTVTVTPPTLTKGTQGSTGFSTQDLKDAGRSRVLFNSDAVAVATTEGLVTFTKNVAGTATATQTTYTVTAGKTFRVQAIIVSLTDTSTTVARTRIRLRENIGGTCIASSPLAVTTDFGPLPGTQAAGMALQGPFVIPLPDGLEFPAGDSICMSEVATTNTTAVLSVSLIGYEY